MRYRRKKSLPLPLVLLVLVVCLIGWAGYSLHVQYSDRVFETVAPSVAPDAAAGASVPEEPEVSEDPDDHDVSDSEYAAEEPVVILETVQKGDTAGKILQPYLNPGQVQALADACEECFSLRLLRVGKPYEITLDNGEFTQFVYEIDADKRLIAHYADGQFGARLEDIVYDVTVEQVRGSISSHLFQAVSDAGETPMLAFTLADIFAWEINFIRDIHPGDSFNLLVGKTLP